MSATRVLFDEPGPRTRRRILIASVISLLAIAGIVYLAIARFADSGQLAGREVERADHAAGPFVPLGRPGQHHEADGGVRRPRVAAGCALRAAAVGAQQGAALGRHDVRRGVPVGAVAVAGADVRAGAAAAGDQPADLLEDLRADRDVQRRDPGGDLPGRGQRAAEGSVGGIAGDRVDLLAGDAAGDLPAGHPVDHPGPGHPAGVAAQGLDLGYAASFPELLGRPTCSPRARTP